MDDQNIGDNKFLKLQRLHHLAVIRVVCTIIYWFGLSKRKLKDKVCRTVGLEADYVRLHLLNKFLTHTESRSITRMSPAAFIKLCDLLVMEGGLRPTLRVCVEEQVAKALYLFGHNVTNRELRFFFERSGETVSRHFHNVLSAIIELEDKFLKQPNGSDEVPSEILHNTRFFPYFKVNPHAAEWKNKKLRNYDKLCELFAKDRATGENAETATEIRRRRFNTFEESNVEASFNNIDDIDLLVSQNNIFLENLNAFRRSNATSGNSQNNSQLGGNAENINPADVEVPSKNKRHKKVKVDEETSLLKMGLDNVAQAITDSTVELVKATISKLPISESEVWNMLVDLGVEEEKCGEIYLFLLERPDELRGLLGCPPNYRKNLLLQMMRKVNVRNN